MLEKCWVSNVYSRALWPPNHYCWPGTTLGSSWLSSPISLVILTKDAEHPKAVNSARPRRQPQLCSPAGVLQWEVGQPCPIQAAVE